MKVMFMLCLDDHEEDLLEIFLMFRLKGKESSQNLYDLSYRNHDPRRQLMLNCELLNPYEFLSHICITNACLKSTCSFISRSFSKYIRACGDESTGPNHNTFLSIGTGSFVSYSNITTAAHFSGIKYLLGDSAFTPSQIMVPCVRRQISNTWLQNDVTVGFLQGKDMGAESKSLFWRL